MSIKTALESEGVDFSEYMNIPEPWDGSAQIKQMRYGQYVIQKIKVQILNHYLLHINMGINFSSRTLFSMIPQITTSWTERLLIS